MITAQSPKAAEAGQCAAEQDKFWEYHDYIYEETPQGALSNTNLKDYASAVGLERSQFEECLDSGKYTSAVQVFTNQAREAGARGTPTFFVNGVQTAPMLDNLSAQIDAELARTKFALISRIITGKHMNELTALRSQIDAFMGGHPQSPLSHDQRRIALHGLNYYEANEHIYFCC